MLSFLCIICPLGQVKFSLDEYIMTIYYIPINNSSFELSVFWPSDTESGINELRFSDSVSLSFKTRLKSIACFCGDVT